MEPPMFRDLLQRLTPRLTKQNTNLRKPLQLAEDSSWLTLRYLTSGNSYRSLAYSHNTMSLFAVEVSKPLLQSMKKLCLSRAHPRNGKLSEKFGFRWNFRNIIGSIHGKHIAIKALSNSGSLYHNYKGFILVILLGVVDAN